MGKDYLRVENKVEHATTYYEVQVGRNAGGIPSLLLPLANDDLLPICYVTKRSFDNGRNEASIFVPSDADRNAVVSEIVGFLKLSPHFSRAEVSCIRQASELDSWRVTIHSQQISAEELISIFDRAEEKFGGATKLTDKEIGDINAFLRSKPSQ